MEKQAILAVSFGTSYPETREKTIDRIEEDMRQAYPDDTVYRAWTLSLIHIWICRIIQTLNSLMVWASTPLEPSTTMTAESAAISVR